MKPVELNSRVLASGLSAPTPDLAKRDYRLDLSMRESLSFELSLPPSSALCTTRLVACRITSADSSRQASERHILLTCTQWSSRLYIGTVASVSGRLMADCWQRSARPTPSEVNTSASSRSPCDCTALLQTENNKIIVRQAETLQVSSLPSQQLASIRSDH